MPVEALFPLITYPDPTSAGSVASAVKAARLIGARLHGMALEVQVPAVSNALSGALVDVRKLAAEAEALSRKRGEELLRTISSAADEAGITCETETARAIEAEFGNVIATAARYHDVSFVGWDPLSRTVRATTEALIFDSGRPVLLLPETAPEDFNHIAIAWDGSRVAARAVGDALALFGNATRATVILVTDEKAIPDTKGAERLAAFLTRRRLEAKAHYATTAGRAIGETLQAEARAVGADTLVMGAYGHSRLRQFILGGATRGILDNLQLPVLLSH